MTDLPAMNARWVLRAWWREDGRDYAADSVTFGTEAAATRVFRDTCRNPGLAGAPNSADLIVVGPVFHDVRDENGKWHPHAVPHASQIVQDSRTGHGSASGRDWAQQVDQLLRRMTRDVA